MEIRFKKAAAENAYDIAALAAKMWTSHTVEELAEGFAAAINDPEEPYRKQGCAKQLLTCCEQWAKEKSCTEFASDCELYNEISRQFHLGAGFREANRIICFVKKI